MSIIRGGSSTSSLPYADLVRQVASDQPFRWLRLGWQDFIAAPAASLCLGLLFAIIGLVLTVWLWRGQAMYLLLPLAGGFMLIGPALTLGFHAISRDLERRERPSFVRALLAWRANAGPILNFGLGFMCFFLLWLRLAQAIFALTFPQVTPLDAQSLLNATFFTIDGLAFTTLFLALGAAMAALAFVAGAFAMPMLLDRQVDVIKANGDQLHRRDAEFAYHGVVGRDAGGAYCGRDSHVLHRPRRHSATGGACDVARLQGSDHAGGRVVPEGRHC